MFSDCIGSINEGLRDLAKEILEVKCFIPKPLTIEDLVRKVKEELVENSRGVFQGGQNLGYTLSQYHPNSSINGMSAGKYIKERRKNSSDSELERWIKESLLEQKGFEREGIQ